MSVEGVGFFEDRFTQGLFAGIAGWFPQMIFTQTMYWVFHVTKFRYLDFAAVMTFGARPKGFWQYIFAEFLVVLVLGFAGIVFAMLIKGIHSPNIILKGILHGALCWYLIYSVFSLFKLEGVYHKIDFLTAVMNLTAAAIWGVVMAGAFLYLNRKYGVKN